MKPTLVVMAAGMGSRYGGVKQIDAVGMHNECLLDYGIYDALHSGYGKVVFIIRKDIEKDFRERLFDRIAGNMDAEYVFQTKESLLTEDEVKLSAGRTKPWGTIHAVLCAENAVHTPFTVVNADDYYGRSAYAVMGRYLSSLDNSSTDHAMVGFTLENTMSPSGSVTRALCKADSDGFVTSLVETFKILRKDGRVVSILPDGEEYLTGKELVSMNFFGFTPRIFEGFHTFWDEFKRENITSSKAECLLATGVCEIIGKGEGRMKLLSSSDRWFGMTYPEDKPQVVKALREKIRSGYYPEKLWEK
jgi:hypothetical protein